MLSSNFFYNRKERNTAETLAENPKNDEIAIERNAYTDWKFIIFTIFCALFSIAFFQILNTLPLFYKDVVKLSQSEIGLLLGFSGFCVFVFEMLLVHWAEKKFTITEILFYGSIVTGISYSIFGFSHWLPIMYMAIFLMSIGEMLVLPFISTVTALRAGIKNKGAYMGLNGLSGALAFIVSPYLGTVVATKYNFEILWFGTAIVLLLTAVGFKLTVNQLLDKK